jgi:hypothetical protein
VRTPTLIGVTAPGGAYTARYLHWGDHPDALVPMLRRIWATTFSADTAAMTPALVARDWSSLQIDARRRRLVRETPVRGVGYPAPSSEPTPRRGPLGENVDGFLWPQPARIGRTDLTLRTAARSAAPPGRPGIIPAAAASSGWGDAVGLPAAAREILAGMGGKNRGRRARAQTAPTRRPTARGRTRQVLRLPGMREVYDAVIAACADLEAAADALDAELWLAANVCAIRAEAPDDDAFHLAMLDLIDEAERDARRQCLLLLKTMAAAGPQGAGRTGHPRGHTVERPSRARCGRHGRPAGLGRHAR